jgi:2-polyprenyl-6-methoxyphenol hydroxylase-like FAD-dependent oxidoreductase
MGRRRVLISGAGIAGPTLAYWLVRRGFEATVVERARGRRSSGSPVDVRGGAVAVAERMGIMERLREVATRVPGLTILTDSGRRIGPVALGRPGEDEVEVLRTDLAAALHDVTRDDAEFIFGDAITELRQDAGGVDVTFERAAPRRYDLVVGADGLHSGVRALAFGPEDGCVRHLGLYIATLQFGEPAAEPGAVLLHNRPGRLVAMHPARGDSGVAFIFRGPAVPGLDHRDTERHKRIVLDAYGDGGWELPGVPDLLDRLRAAGDLYFDGVSRVRLPSWSRGRVVLVGDAAATVSLFGDGSSLALTGACTLAEALAASPDDHAGALRAYEAEHRARAQARQRGYRVSAGFLVPATRAGIAARNLAVRLLPRQRATRVAASARSEP